MPLKLYYTITSTPSRSVIHTLNALNVSYEKINLNLRQHEQFSEDFLKVNPYHTVPTIVENDGFVLWESHAINGYLVKKYGKEDSLYRKDWRLRAIVDQKLYFHSGIFFIPLKTIFRKVVKEKTITKLTDELKTSVKEAYDLLENFLSDGRPYVTGNDITIADLSILPTLNNLSVFVPVNSKTYPLITEYVKRSEAKVPGFKEVEEEGKKKFREILKVSEL